MILVPWWHKRYHSVPCSHTSRHILPRESYYYCCCCCCCCCYWLDKCTRHDWWRPRQRQCRVWWGKGRCCCCGGGGSSVLADDDVIVGWAVGFLETWIARSTPCCWAWSGWQPRLGSPAGWPPATATTTTLWCCWFFSSS